MHTTLISVKDLQKNIEKKNWVILDCRFTLDDSDAGLHDYRKEHIAGAMYVDLNKDLSGAIIEGETGRHPLPEPEDFAVKCAMWGIGPKTQVIVYDNANGALAAARCWWLLKWLGHEAVAVLDGGLHAWNEAGGTLTDEVVQPEPGDFDIDINYKLMVEADDVLSMLGEDTFPIVDSRSAERYLGKNETIDSKGGHIPGAISAPYSENLSEEGTLKSEEDLQSRFRDLLKDHNGEDCVFYCGSGVTACHNILACAHSGLGMPRLYPGSWSEWITDESRPTQ